MKRNVGQNLRINKWYIFMMLPENELPLFERPAAATAPNPRVMCILYITYIIWPKANSKQMHAQPHTDLEVFICYTALLGRVILYYGFFRTEVSKRGPGGLVSCRVQLQP